MPDRTGDPDDIAALTLEDLDQIDGVVDDDALGVVDPGEELDDEFDRTPGDEDDPDAIEEEEEI